MSNIEVINAQAPQIGPAKVPNLIYGEAIRTGEVRLTPRGMERWRLTDGNTETVYTPASWVRVANTPGASVGNICFVFDDSYVEHYDACARIKTAGGKATIGHLSGVIDGGGRLSSAQLLSLHEQGHEIAAHSTTHQDMVALDAAGRASQWDGVISQITTKTGAAPTNWIYPVSSRTDEIDHEGYARGFGHVFTGATAGAHYIVNNLSTRPYAIGRMSLTGSTLDKAEEAIMLAGRSAVTVVMYAHQIDASGNITWADLDAMIALCVSQGVNMTTLAEAFPAHQPLPHRTLDGIAASVVYDITTANGATAAGDSAAGSQPPGFAYATQGVRALKFTSAADNGSARAALIDGIPARGGESFAIRAFLALTKTSGSGALTTELDEYDWDGNLIRTTVLDSLTATTAYAQYATSIVLDRRTIRVKPAYKLNNLTATGYVFAPHPGEAMEVGATPPLPSTIANATDAATAISQLNLALAALRTHGLIDH